MKKLRALALIAAVAAPGLASAQDDSVVRRPANREQAAAAMRAIKGIVDTQAAPSEALKHAAKLKELQVAFVTMFSANSEKGRGNALPSVWTDARGFASANEISLATYDRLAIAAGSGDRTALGTAWSDAARACGACHDKYRAK